MRGLTSLSGHFISRNLPCAFKSQVTRHTEGYIGIILGS